MACGWLPPAARAVGVDLGGPRAGVPTVVGEDRHCLTQELVAGPPEADARCLPDWLVTGLSPLVGEVHKAGGCGCPVAIEATYA